MCSSSPAVCSQAGEHPYGLYNQRPRANRYIPSGCRTGNHRAEQQKEVDTVLTSTADYEDITRIYNETFSRNCLLVAKIGRVNICVYFVVTKASIPVQTPVLSQLWKLLTLRNKCLRLMWLGRSEKRSRLFVTATSVCSSLANRFRTVAIGLPVSR